MESKNQEILTEMVIKQDRKAQKEVYETYKDAMFTICYRITGNYEDAKDALQDGFIAVFNNIKSFKGSSTLGAWIKTIMVRNALRRLPKIKFEPETEIVDSLIIFDLDFNGNELHKAIMNLDQGYRSVFLLYEVEGYSHKEIAEMLSISEGTSKSQLHHAKKKLKSILEGLSNYELTNNSSHYTSKKT